LRRITRITVVSSARIVTVASFVMKNQTAQSGVQLATIVTVFVLLMKRKYVFGSMILRMSVMVALKKAVVC